VLDCCYYSTMSITCQSFSLFLYIEFAMHIESYQLSLYHGDQIALVVRHDEPVGTSTPSTSLDELVIVFTMFFDCGVKDNQWTAIVLEFTHDP
jgi:hypothetical protein